MATDPWSEGMQDKQSFVEYWTKRVIGIYKVLNPKLYNKITWILIVVGVFLLPGSVSIVKALVLAAWNRWVGDASYLEKLLLMDGDPYWGAFIVCLALVYHLLSQYGEAALQAHARSAPPELEFEFFSLSGDLHGSAIKAQGWSIDDSMIGEVPDYPLSRPDDDRLIDNFVFSGALARADSLSEIISGRSSNRDLFRQRLRYLYDFAGAVYLQCHLTNSSDRPANKIKVRLNICGRCSIRYSHSLTTSLPVKEELSLGYVLPGSYESPYTDIDISDWDGGGRIEWECGYLNAKDNKAFDSAFWINPKENVTVSVEIFAAELEGPIVSEFFIEKASAKEVTMDYLTNDGLFEESVKAQEVDYNANIER